MANYSELLNDINAAIYENNDQEIDALEVRAILREMVTSLGSGFLFKGIATPSSPSGTGTYEPDQNVFYLATTAGTYTYLGGLVVAAGEVAFLCYDGTWTKKSSALLSTGSIVDNTTTEDATKPLSAKQGKVLADAGAATAAEVTALGQKVDDLDVEINGTPVTRELGWKNWTNFNTDRQYRYAQEKVQEGDVISVKLNDYSTYGFSVGIGSSESYAVIDKLNTGWLNADYSHIVTAAEANGYCRIVIRKNNDVAITSTEAAGSIILETIVRDTGAVSGGIVTELSSIHSDISSINNELYGGEVPRQKELGWKSWNTFNSNRAYHFAKEKVQAGDVISIKLTDYSAYNLAVTIGSSENYGSDDKLQTGWLTADFTHIVTLAEGDGYCKLAIRKSNDAAITTAEAASAVDEASITRNYTITTDGLEKRISDIEDSTKVSPVSGQYIGGRIMLAAGRFNLSSIGVLPSPLTTYMQSMAIHGDYVIGVYSGLSTLRASVWQISTMQKLADLTLSYGSVQMPHANTCCFGVEYASGNTMLPLLYVSQWDGEGGVLVYNIGISGGSWFATLVQTIMFSGMDSDVFGSDLGDVVVDDRGFLWTMKYKINSATTETGNGQNLCKFPLPSIADGASISYGPSDILDHFEVPFIPINQDKSINGGKMYVAAGAEGYSQFPDCQRISVIDLTTKQIVSVVPLASFGGEPEALSIDGGEMYLTFATNWNLNRLKFD